MGLFLVKFQVFIMNRCFGMKQKNKISGLIEIDSSALVNIRLKASSDSFTFVYICLVTRLHSSTFLYTPLDLSSDSSVFLEQTKFPCVCKV